MVRLTVEFGPARHTAEILIKPNMVEKEIPVATGIRRPRITPIEDPMLPDLLPAPKK